jgi:5-methylthioribose kinase
VAVRAPMNCLDIEQHDALRRYLCDSGRLVPGEALRCTTLAGGVSNRTVLVERANGPAWVIKQALARLRVKDEWLADPCRVHREALGLRWLARLAPPGHLPAFVFEDEARHLLAMDAVPHPHANWKTVLLSGGLDLAHVRAFGALLGTIHRRGHELASETEAVFADRSFFQSLRLDPYYRAAAARQPAAAPFYDRLIADTLAVRLTVVHGDYSPKNVLLHAGRLILLDHEVIHFGDPAFDLGFALTHLLSKAHHLAGQRVALLEAAGVFWASYCGAAEHLATTPDLERRAVRHTLGCLLARVDGRSPLEYLTEPERVRQRGVVLGFMSRPPDHLPRFITAFGAALG